MKINNKGITLVALVITIVVLLILAGITLSLVLGQNGIITRAKEASRNYNQASEEEGLALANLENYINDNANGNSTPTTFNPKVTIKATNEEVEVTSSNISSLIGTEVVYNPTGDQNSDGTPKGTWRIFYLDTENKYKDGKNTLYLKRDWTSSSFGQNSHKSYTTDITDTAEVNRITNCMKKMNTLWATTIDANGYAGKIDQDGENECAYFLDPNNWNDTYLDSNVASYAIGSPSVEMFVDAYNQWGGYEEGKGPIDYRFVEGDCGYDLGTDGVYTRHDRRFDGVNLSEGPSKMFNGKYTWYVASTIRSGATSVFVTRTYDNSYKLTRSQWWYGAFMSSCSTFAF